MTTSALVVFIFERLVSGGKYQSVCVKYISLYVYKPFNSTSEQEICSNLIP